MSKVHKEIRLMKVQLKVAGMLAALVLVATVALTHGPKVQAAGTARLPEP